VKPVKGKPTQDAYGRLECSSMTPRVASAKESALGYRTKESIHKRSQSYTKEDRIYDHLSVERLDYPECKSTVFRHTDFDERSAGGERLFPITV
jgi:hypothetical protein